MKSAAEVRRLPLLPVLTGPTRENCSLAGPPRENGSLTRRLTLRRGGDRRGEICSSPGLRDISSLKGRLEGCGEEGETRGDGEDIILRMGGREEEGNLFGEVRGGVVRLGELRLNEEDLTGEDRERTGEERREGDLQE